ncbi:MAG: hypothetical protein E7543_09325 [Ruminococcaceae bacterium]|nr:hypothetical protein [Oscillospiraceae bacterium]
MKKLLAVLLCVICLFSCLAPSAGAAKGGVIGEITVNFFERLLGEEFEQDTSIGYGVIYDTDPLSGVSVVYKPSPSVSFENPGTYTITSDTPLSIDYEFVCWKDSHGNRYDAGDKIYVDGTVTLTAVWVEKNDGDIRVARIIKTTFEAFKRLIGKFFGILDTMVNFEPDPTVPGRYDLTLTGIYYEDTDYTKTEGDERVLIYIDSFGFKDEFMRIDERDGEKDMSTVKIELFTDWDKALDKPINGVAFTGLTYSFSEINGPENEDVIIVPTVLADGTDVVSKYVQSAGITEGQTFYMTVTVESRETTPEEIAKTSLYYCESSEAKLGYEYTAPVSVAFTLVTE